MNLLKVIFVLAILIVIIVMLIRFLGNRNRAWMSNRSIRTLGAVGLGPNKSLQVIEIGGSLYLIGVGENVSVLDKITDPDEIALIMASFEDQAGYSGTLFKEIAAKLRKGKGGVSSQEIDLNENPTFYEMLQSKIRSAPDRKQRIEDLMSEDDREKRQDEP